MEPGKVSLIFFFCSQGSTRLYQMSLMTISERKERLVKQDLWNTRAVSGFMVLSLVKVTVLEGFTGYHQRGVNRWTGCAGLASETEAHGWTATVSMMHLTQHSCICVPCSLTLSESAPSSLLPDFQPVLPVRPLGLQTGAPAAAPFPQIATVRHFPLPALPSGRGALHAHR